MSRSPEVPYTVHLKFPLYFEIPLPVVPFWMDSFCGFNKDLVIACFFTVQTGHSKKNSLFL